MTQGPLSGVRVLDISMHLSGALAGMLLADQGAGTIALRSPDRADLVPDELRAVLDRNKKVFELEAGAIRLSDLVFDLSANTDILVHDLEKPELNALGLSMDELRSRYPDLVILSITAFSESDSIDMQGPVSDGAIAAMTGQFTDLHLMRRLFGLDPVYTPLPIASVYAAVQGAATSILALRARKGARGMQVNVNRIGAALSAMTSMYMSIHPHPARYETPRLPGPVKNVVLPMIRRFARRGGPQRQQKILTIARKSYPALMSSYRCADGKLLYVFAVDNRKLTEALLETVGLTDQLLSEGYVLTSPYEGGDLPNNLAETSNLSRKRQGVLKSHLSEVFETGTSQEWMSALRAAGIPCAVQQTTEDWLNDDDLKKSGAIIDLKDSRTGDMRQLGLQCWLSSSSDGLARPGPRQIVSTSVRATPSEEQPEPLPANSQLQKPSEWLKGVRVIDMSSMVAGPVAGRALAEYGADVLKVEPPHPNHGPRMTCWYGADVNCGKTSMVLDLSDPAGLDVFKALIEQADILISNHLPDAMRRMGVDTAQLHAWNSRLLICRVGAYNGPHRGPHDQYAGYDPVLQAASGIMTRYGNPGAPDLHAIASCVDALTGFSGLFGVAMALRKRDETGKGDVIDVSLAASASLVQIPFAYAYEGRVWNEPAGQLAKGQGPLSGLYKCQDGWVYLGQSTNGLKHLPMGLKGKRASAPLSREQVAGSVIQMTCDETVQVFRSSGHEACRVTSVTDAWTESAPHPVRRRMRRNDVPGLGQVGSIYPDPVDVDGFKLKELTPAVRPGSNGADCEHWLEKEVLDRAIGAGVIKNGFHQDYLP